MFVVKFLHSPFTMNFYRNIKIILLTSIVLLSSIISSFDWTVDGSELKFDWSESTRVFVGGVILVIIYVLIIFELVDRTLAALIGASLAIAAYDYLLGYVGMKQLMQWVDLETLSLLIGMMIISNILSLSGLFDYLALYSYQKARGRLWLLIVVMSSLVAFLAAFIDNVSTMLLLTPTLIKLSELEDLDPRYVLMLMAIISNLGGTATPVGDPPNLIIISDDLVANKLGITFNSFVCYAAPCVLISLLGTLLYVKLIYKSGLGFRSGGNFREKLATFSIGSDEEEETDLGGRSRNKIQLKQQLHIVPSNSVDMIANEIQLLKELKLLEWIEEKLAEFNSENMLSSDFLELKRGVSNQTAKVKHFISNLNTQVSIPNESTEAIVITRRQPNKGAPQGRNLNDLITSRTILIQSTLVLVGAILLFFAQSTFDSRLTLGWISLFASLTLLTLSSGSKVPKQGLGAALESSPSREERSIFDLAISHIEWDTLIFFFALFIIMEVMSELGLISFLGQEVSQLIGLIPAGKLRSIGAITIILWSSAISSAFVDNIPITSMMIKILTAMTTQTSSSLLEVNETSQALNMKALVFALTFGVCFGGNGTLIGASANLVTANRSSRAGYPITFNRFFKFSLPITILTLLICNIYLLVVFVVFDL